MQDHGDKWLCPPRDERSYMRADTTGHSGTKQQKRPFCFFFLSLLRLTSERYPTIRCRWPECASLLIACPGTNRCHPVTTPPPTTTTTTHMHTRLRANRQGKELARVQQPWVCVSAAGEALPQAAQGRCSATGPNSKECFK